MPLIKLSPRLEAIAKLVPSHGGACDVGTDHGYIPVWLAQNGHDGAIFATDIKKEPLLHAKRTADEYQLSDRISFHLCDGLAALDGSSIETVIIAGMGGENIADIILAAPWVKENGCLLVLQPMSKSSFLRKWLFENGFKVISEHLVEDGSIYEILTARAGKDEPYSHDELLNANARLISNSPLFEKRLDNLITRTERAAAGLSTSAKAEDSEHLAQSQAVLISLRKLKSGV
ncbi:MAG: class I SAM-dependent methyltransferase [Oscillospiraceae bacterium]